jgi:hypothetical protein
VVVSEGVGVLPETFDLWAATFDGERAALAGPLVAGGT